MILMMDDDTPDEWGGNPVEKFDKAFVISDDQLDDSFDLIEAREVIRKLEVACDKALLLRGLMAAINDPLALEGEKQTLRERFLKIEKEIREAICEATKFRRKQK